MNRPQGSLERKALVEALQDNSLWASPGQDPCLQECVYWWVKWVDPKTESENLIDPKKNIMMMIYLEASPWVNGCQARDEDLDCQGFSLEDCLVDLALKVNLRASPSYPSEGNP